MRYSCILDLEIIIRGKNRLSCQKGKTVILCSNVVKKLFVTFISILEVIITSLSFEIDEMEYDRTQNVVFLVLIYLVILLV